jgi:hypothetical protein
MDIESQGSVRTIMFTDDTDREEIIDAVRIAQRRAGRTVVFLTPTVLYSSTPLSDIEDAYQEYVAFESFRQDLTALPRVTAYEVGPADRMQEIMSATPRTDGSQ